MNDVSKTSPATRRLTGRRMAAAAWVAFGLTCGGAAEASLVFSFDYSSNAAGVGFLDPTYGAARQAALTDAGNRYSALFGSYFSDSGTITVKVTSSDDPNSGTLASAGSRLVDGGAPGLIGEVVRNKLQTGVDLNGNSRDATVNVNWGQLWELNYNTVPSGGKYDFYSTVFHEFTHALGFMSTIEKNGDPIIANQWSAFDLFLVDKHGNPVIDTTTYTLDQPVWQAAAMGGLCDGVLFGGPNATAANGGNPVCLYSPTTWDDGSSISHLDDDTYPTAMMRHAGPPDIVDARDFSAIEVGILTDLGYARNAVPEPSVLALLIGGLAALRHRRQGSRPSQPC